MAKEKAKVDILALDESGAYIHSPQEMEDFIAESNVRILEHQKEITRLTKLCSEEAVKQNKVDAVLRSFDTKEALQKRESERLAAMKRTDISDTANKANKLKKLRELSHEV